MRFENWNESVYNLSLTTGRNVRAYISGFVSDILCEMCQMTRYFLLFAIRMCTKLQITGEWDGKNLPFEALTCEQH